MRGGLHSDSSLSSGEIQQGSSESQSRSFWSRNPIIIDKSMQGLDGSVRVYKDIVPALTAREYKEPRMVGIQIIGTTNPDRHSTADIHGVGGVMSTMCGRDYKQPKQVGIPLKLGNVNPSRNGINGNVYYSGAVSPTLTTNKGEGSKIAIPVLTPDRAEKRQNGRRFKENGEPAFTLTAQDKHGVAIGVGGGDMQHEDHPGMLVELPNGVKAWAVWYEKEQCYIAIRKLTPRECFRLQGWTDDYFEKAEFVNSDSQLYRQAGNGITVNVVEAIGRRMNAERQQE